ncbi:MAG: ABC transporter substrate-binding protein [Acidimicrobiales bacterium]
MLTAAACSSTPATAPVVSPPPPSISTTTARIPADPFGRTPGGTLVYGLEAPASGLLPSESGCDVSCRQLLATIADPLVARTSAGDIVPFVLEAIVPSDDYFTWTLTVRDDVAFHDDTLLTGAELAAHIDRCRLSPLTSAWFAPIVAVTADGPSVTLDLAEPWLSFPDMLVTHPCNFVVRGLPDAPIGTGPFAIPVEALGTAAARTGDGLVVTRFDDYWRGSRGTGEDLPLLDRIEFTVQPSVDDRARLLAGHALSAYQTSQPAPGSLSSTLGTDPYQLVFNVADPTRLGSVDDCRHAFAAATDRSAFVPTPDLAASGPFGPDELGYLEALAFDPPPDVAASMADCVAAGSTSELTILTTADPVAAPMAQSMASQWNDGSDGAITVTVTEVDPIELSERALVGDFDAIVWRNGGGLHPDAWLPWWHSASIADLGTISLNIGRFADPSIDQALKTLRIDPLPLEQQRAAQEITRAFDRADWIIWLAWTRWSIVAGPRVHGLDNPSGPDGTDLTALVAGAHPTATLWCDNAACS